MTKREAQKLYNDRRPSQIVYPDTPFQRQLGRAAACTPARLWVWNKSMYEAVKGAAEVVREAEAKKQYTSVESWLFWLAEKVNATGYYLYAIGPKSSKLEPLLKVIRNGKDGDWLGLYQADRYVSMAKARTRKQRKARLMAKAQKTRRTR